MPSSALALQQSIFEALAADAALVALLGAPRIYDDTPQPATFPYITFGASQTRDYDSTTSAADEHIVTLHVWSREAGRKQAHEIVGAMRQALHDRPLALPGHRLINLRHDFSEARRDPDGETIRGLLRLRAVTEPL
jgi:hypothetical protein